MQHEIETSEWWLKDKEEIVECINKLYKDKELKNENCIFYSDKTK